jgi:hypothetical protein
VSTNTAHLFPNGQNTFVMSLQETFSVLLLPCPAVTILYDLVFFSLNIIRKITFKIKNIPCYGLDRKSPPKSVESLVPKEMFKGGTLGK